MLFGHTEHTNYKDEHCYCKYGESGIMINCENESCNRWFHADDCLGLSESEILNINKFYCSECLNKNSNLSIQYFIPPISRNSFCNCSGPENGLMIECGKCHNWYHSECINLTPGEINAILIYFCQNCITTHPNLKLIYKDYSKEHTKPLYLEHEILTVHNLYPYHTLLDLYKILKFRTPYCMYDILNTLNSHRGGLNFCVPKTSNIVQKKTFIYQAILYWNRFYKKLLNPFTIILHNDHKIKSDTTTSKIIVYDYSNSASSFKLKLKSLLIARQQIGNLNTWSDPNFTLW